MSDPRTFTTTTLLEGLALQGDASVWESFDKRYRPVLAGYCAKSFGLNPSDAEEVAQETLAKFAISYRGGKYERGKGRLRSWLMRIAHNTAIDAIRAKRGHARVDDSRTAFAELLPTIGPPGEDDRAFHEAWDSEQARAIAAQAWEIVRSESRLDERTLMAFEFSALRGMATDLVASHCGMTADEVYVAKTRVTRKLQQVERDLRDAYEMDA